MALRVVATDSQLHGRKAVDDRDAGGGYEVECAVGDGGVGLLAGEGEAGEGAIGFFNLDGGDGAGGGDGEPDLAHSFLLAFGRAGEEEVAVGSGGEAEIGQFLFKLSVAEEEAERGAQIVELFGEDALDLIRSGRVGPGVFAVEEEDFAGRRRIIPAHAAGFEQEQRAALGSVDAEALIGLREAGAEGMELIVVGVDEVRDFIGRCG